MLNNKVLNFFTVFTLILICNVLHAQEIKDIIPVKDGNFIIVNYHLDAGKKSYNIEKTFNIDLIISLNGGRTFNDTLRAVSGDVGENVKEGFNKIIWDVFKDMEGLAGDVIFDVRLTIVEKKITKKFFISYTGSVVSPFGLSVGKLGGTGWYISAKSSLLYSNPEYEYGGEYWDPEFNEPQYYIFNKTQLTKRYSFTLGINYQVSKNIYLYGGAGYGFKEMILQMDIYSYINDEKINDAYVKKPEESYSGIETELGIVYKYKNIIFSTGLTNVNLKSLNWTFGIGYYL